MLPPTTLAAYQALPYTRYSQLVVEEDGTRYWVAWIEELPGCKAGGQTEPEAYQQLNDAFDDYIEAKLAWGSQIPVPAKHAALMSTSEIIPDLPYGPKSRQTVTKHEGVVETEAQTDWAPPMTQSGSPGLAEAELALH